MLKVHNTLNISKIQKNSPLGLGLRGGLHRSYAIFNPKTPISSISSSISSSSHKFNNIKLNHFESNIVKHVLNNQQQRSESTLTIPKPKTQNQKTAYVAGAALLMGACFYILDRLYNQAGVGSQEYISPEVRKYLSGVYAYLTGGIAITAATAIACWRSGFVMEFLSRHPTAFMLGSTLLCIGTLMATRSVDPRNFALKNSLYIAYTVLEGITLTSLGILGGPVLAKAGIYTFGIFLAMSLIALNAKQERFLYLGGALYSALFVMIMGSFASMGLSIFGKMPRTVAALDFLILWGGLALFVAFLLYHTQTIVSNGKQYAELKKYGQTSTALSVRGHNGQIVPNYIDEALRLYLDLINIFIRLAVIFSGRNNKK